MNRRFLFVVLVSVFFSKLLFGIPRDYFQLQKINDLVAKEEIDLLKKNINYLKTLKNDILAKNINKTVFGLLLKKVEFAIGKKKSRKAKKFKKKKRKKPVVPKFDIKKARLAIKKIKKTAPWELAVKDWKMAQRALKKFPKILDNKKDKSLKILLGKSFKETLEELELGMIEQISFYDNKIKELMEKKYNYDKNYEKIKKRLLSLK